MAVDPAAQPIDAQVLGSTEVDEGALRQLLRRAGRAIARPALECLELMLDPGTPPQVRLTMLAALTYLLVPVDLIPDFIPAAGFSCLLYTSPSPRDLSTSRMPSSA